MDRIKRIRLLIGARMPKIKRRGTVDSHPIDVRRLPSNTRRPPARTGVEMKHPPKEADKKFDTKA